ncbi:ribonuclease D [Xanthomonas sp. JAI131]|uniref:ribonuclease D n=1 Tax=Xanthomonas sp. JAI131 TaxID=2723067 RepID=UPI0015C82CE3|nr:ribonuclease D [Xanthomonas sp. JAI131]NYF21841.1 ribonuclease D [Xanthomonas sp. JAI131]
MNFVARYEIKLCTGDLPVESSFGDFVAIDIETSGLDFRFDRIGSIQVFNGSLVYVVRPPFGTPERLAGLLENPGIKKIFHHAMFDLRFICSNFIVNPKNICCTKVAAKIVDRDIEKHSLSLLLNKYLGVTLDKRLQTSDWVNGELSQAQLDYAARDTIYLRDLLCKIMEGASEGNLAEIYSSFYYIPTRVSLDVAGVGDVFSY